MSAGDGSWREVGAGVFQRRYEPVDVSVGAIVGPSGVVIVDTRNNPREGEEILRDAEVPPDELAASWPDRMLRSALRAGLSPAGDARLRE